MHLASSRAQFEMHTLSLSQPMVHWTRIPTHCSLQILPSKSSTQFSFSFGLYDSYACVKCDKNNEHKNLFIMALFLRISQSILEIELLKKCISKIRNHLFKNRSFDSTKHLDIFRLHCQRSNWASNMTSKKERLLTYVMMTMCITLEAVAY